MRFYTIFTIVYSIMNLTVFAACVRYFNLSGIMRTSTGVFCLAMIVSPFAQLNMTDGVGPWAFLTYTWLGVVFLLFLSSLAVFALDPLLGRTPARTIFIGMSVLVACASLYGVANARYPQIIEVELKIKGLPEDFKELRLALISDLHLYSVEAEDRLERLLKKLEGQNYDALISLGDLIETGIHRAKWEDLAVKFARINPRYGKLAILGNHEVYADISAGTDIAADFHKAAGFDLLVDESRDLAGAVTLFGMDYVGQRAKTVREPGEEARMLGQARHGLPLLLLRHLPNIEPETAGLFAAQISGHTHGGQLWPFVYLVKTRFEHIKGLFALPGGEQLYVNQGTGTWGPPIRIGTTPEVTLLRILPDNG